MCAATGTQQGSSVTAITHVLETTELLEMILLQLPASDLVHAQRVCGKWHAVTRESIKLRNNLFLTAISPQSYICWKEIRFTGRSALPVFLTTRPLEGHHCSIFTRVHPLLVSRIGGSRRDHIRVVLYAEELAEWGSGSWFPNMLIMQPPPTELVISSNKSMDEYILRNEHGITLGMIREQVLAECKEEAASPLPDSCGVASLWFYVEVDGYISEDTIDAEKAVKAGKAGTHPTGVPA